MQVLDRREALRRIVARADLERFGDRVFESFWETPEFQRLHPPRQDVRRWVRWNLQLVIRWLVEGRPPDQAELQVFRQHARARVADGTPADVVPGNFRRGAQFAWRALLEAATDEERPALLEAADLLFEYVDRVSRIYSEVYADASAQAAASAEEGAARALLDRVASEEPPAPEDLQLAERVGVRLDRATRPFVIALRAGTAAEHMELANHLRRRGSLAASEGRRVVGLSARSAPLKELGLRADAVLAAGAPAIAAERGRALQELREVAEVARAHGDRGEVRAEDYLPELLIAAAPRIVERIAARMYGGLDDELTRTLDALVEHDFARAATAAHLPVHRNTLRQRINRISQITGVDLSSAAGHGLAWLAWLSRRGRAGESV
jgi:hypothetical protein